MEQAFLSSFRMLADAVNDVVLLVDAHGLIVAVNDRSEAVLGFTPEALRGTALELLRSPDTRGGVASNMKTLGEAGSLVYETRYRRADGTDIPVEVSARTFPSENGSYGVLVVRDISERLQAARDLQRKGELLQTILDNIPVMIALYESQGAIRLVNRAFETTLGWRLDECRDLAVLAHLYPDADQRRAVLEQIEQSNGRWSDCRTTRRDGHVIDTTWANVTLIDGARIGIGLDISERKENEDRMQRALGLCAAMGEISRATAGATGPAEIFAAACRILCQQGALHIAWIGRIEPSSGALVPVARYPEDCAVIDQIRVSIYAGVAEGRGPAGIAAQTGRPAVCNDFGGDPNTRPWREQAARSGVHASGAFPIREHGRITAMLFVYADRKYFFDAYATILVEEIARNMSADLERHAPGPEHTVGPEHTPGAEHAPGP